MSGKTLYKIKPIFLGSIRNNKKDILYQYPYNEECITVYACYALLWGKDVILVDSGLPSQEDIRRNGKPFRQMADAPDFLTALERTGIDATRVETVILTHLHYDHCCNLRLLPNLKRVFVQKREVLHALHPREDERYYYSLQKKCGKPEWTDALGKLEILDGDHPVLPGIQVFLTPGHSPGSQSVLVQTAKGPHLLTGDYITVMDSYTKCIPNSIINNLDEWYASYDKVKSISAARILTGHDSCIFDQDVYG